MDIPVLLGHLARGQHLVDAVSLRQSRRADIQLQILLIYQGLRGNVLNWVLSVPFR